MKFKAYLFLIVSFLLSSCYSGLDDLPAYDNAEITSISFEYRWEDPNTGTFSVITLNNKDLVIKSDVGTIELSIEVPSVSNKFPENIRNQVSLNKLILVSSISNAAIIEPLENSPKMGYWGDFSDKKFKYKVTAANGSEKVWTIVINDFIK